MSRKYHYGAFWSGNSFDRCIEGLKKKGTWISFSTTALSRIKYCSCTNDVAGMYWIVTWYLSCWTACSSNWFSSCVSLDSWRNSAYESSNSARPSISLRKLHFEANDWLHNFHNAVEWILKVFCSREGTFCFFFHQSLKPWIPWNL